MSTQMQYRILVWVDGKSLGEFDTMTGGATTAERPKRRPGGMRAQKSYVALPDTDDVTVSRVYERVRDHEQARQLRRRAGQAPATVQQVPLDDDGAPWGKPTVFTGHLLAVSPSDVDANSGDVRTLDLTIQVLEVN
jgi:hypothetical protein